MTSFLLAMMLAAGAGKAVNVSRYEGVTLNNPTEVEVRYQLKWGDREYKSFTLAAGKSRIHLIEVDAGNATPTPRVRFDYFLDDGAVTYKSYELKATATDTTRLSDGTQYEFKKVAETEINLFKE